MAVNPSEILVDLESFGDLSEKKIEALRIALKKDILKKVDQGKKPYMAAVLAGALIDKTFKSIFDIIGEGFDETLKNIQKTLLEYDIELNKTEIANIVKLRSTIIEQITIPKGKFKSDLKAALLQNIGKGMSKEEIIDALTNLYPAAAGQIKTLINTSLQHFYKDATWGTIGDQFDYFKYVGPLDEVTRPFCRAHVNKVFTKDEADEIQNIILDFYNCRHSLIGITKTKYDDSEQGSVDASLA